MNYPLPFKPEDQATFEPYPVNKQKESLKVPITAIHRHGHPQIYPDAD